MGSRNNATYFVLLGLTQNPKEKKVLFILFLFIYLLTLMGNILIIVTIAVSKTLNSLMYLFLARLSCMDVTYSTSITPKLISKLLFREKHISFKSCMTQLFAEHPFAGSGVFLLLVMPMTAMWLSVSPCIFFFFFLSSTSLLLPTHLPPPSCIHAQSCNPMDFSPPDSSVHGFFQAKILEWVAISFSSPCIIWWSWGRGCVLWCWCCPGLEVSCIQ